ncbi:MAG: SnoaL-like domain [Thermoleophilaceae bacterium]|jgi:ketosteroid isomerase-like protein|nr:SnoaL-like domain [Thermoleophilaceae bacterium]
MNSSQHFVTVGLRFVEAFNRGDIDACVELLHPDIEWYSSNRYSDNETHVGQQDVRLYLDSLYGHLDEARMEPEDGYQMGEHVMLINRLRGKGTLAGSDVVERYNWVALTDGAKFRRVIAYPTPAEARRALEAAAAATR